MRRVPDVCAPRLRTVCVGVVLLILAAFPAGAGPAGAQDATPPTSVLKEGRLGDARIVNGSKPSQSIDSGGSATEFGLKLPDDASCPGDSTNDDWRLASFLVPASDDPGSLTYSDTKPVGDGRWALYTLDTRSYVSRATGMAEAVGQAGPIDEIPVFSFALYTGGRVPPGAYKIGIACTLYNDVYRFWDTEIVLEADATDEPAQLTWTKTGSQTPDSRGEQGWGRIVLVGSLLAVAVVVVVALVRRRSKPTSQTLSKEEA